MTQQHDFEFQLGKNKTLKGRGWRGLLALCLLLITCLFIATGGPRILGPLSDSFKTVISSR